MILNNNHKIIGIIKKYQNKKKLYITLGKCRIYVNEKGYNKTLLN